MVILIRKAIPKDASQLNKLDIVANKEKPWWEVQSVSEFRKSVKFIFVAESTEEIIGYAQLKKDNKKFWLENIYVLKNYRKKQIAKKLVNCLLKEIKPKYVSLITSDENLRIFEKLGFKKTMNYMVKVIK
ncbi:MAG: GNAT family N-acetyltransferase [Nanoarchaeota archaeon]